MDEIFNYLHARRADALENLVNYLKIPSISSDPSQKQEMVDCAEYTAQLMKNAGLNDVKVHTTKGHPIVVGAWRKAPNRPTVLIYGHYDVQPVDPLALWNNPPFSPHIENSRIFARGSADDKGQILMHIQAIKAILATKGELPVNVCIVVEGEEEFGSANLPEFLINHAQELKADVALVSDSSMWAEGIPAITTSLRGLLFLEMTLTGPNRDLHSGTFGGAVANPLEILARALARVKDDDGRILIPGFYDSVTPIPAAVREQHKTLPFDKNAYFANIGITEGWGESGFTTLEQLWLRPTFEINGIWGGFITPGAKTVLPSKAHAKLSLRLVDGQNPDNIEKLVTDYFNSTLPNSVTLTMSRVTGGGRGVVVPNDFPPLIAAKKALVETFNCEPLLVGEGASIPVVADFKTTLNLNTLLIGFALPDACPHSPNENMHIPTFHLGTESLVRLLYYL
ncbi:MAG: dipeptidase [Magnetococcales bacterium]|nr:dipeptidase [Magnetococcales bacterium]